MCKKRGMVKRKREKSTNSQKKKQKHEAGKRKLAKRKLREVYKKSTLLEKQIFKKHKHDEAQYNLKVRRIHAWLSVYKPPNKIKPAELVEWSDDDWRRRHRPSGKQHTKYILETMPISIKPMEETLIQCIACGKNAVTFYLKQTRSGDESMTRFNNCTACGKEWRCDC